MSRRRIREDPDQFEFDFVYALRQSCVFNMTKKELLDYLPVASRVWLCAAIIALYDEFV